MLGNWTGRQRSLIPPDERGGYISIEAGDEAERSLFIDDDHNEQVGWKVPGRFLSQLEQDRLEDAYLLGMKAAEARAYSEGHRRGYAEGYDEGHASGYGEGVFDAAETAYNAKRRSTEEKEEQSNGHHGETPGIPHEGAHPVQVR